MMSHEGILEGNMRTAFVIGLLFASLTSVAYAQTHAAAGQPAAPAKVIVDGKFIVIKPTYGKQLNQFKKRGVPLYFPTAVPPRYTLSLVKLDEDEDKEHPDYKMEFRDQKHHCVTVESAYSGVGDGPDGDRHLTGASKVFGDFAIDVFKPGSEGNCTKDIYYLSGWLLPKRLKDVAEQAEKNGKMLPSDGRFYHVYGEGITDKEAIAIVQSLMPVTDVR